MPQEAVTTFDIQPYLGAMPIAFGMHRNEVHRLLGPPAHSSPPRDRADFWKAKAIKADTSRYNICDAAEALAKAIDAGGASDEEFTSALIEARDAARHEKRREPG